MPTPVAALLNSPEITFSRDRKGAIGSRLLLNCISPPDPLAPQCLGLIPLPMNRAAKRFGGPVGALADVGSLPQPASDSSQGRAIVTPMPLSNVRRLILFDCGFIRLST